MGAITFNCIHVNYSHIQFMRISATISNLPEVFVAIFPNFWGKILWMSFGNVMFSPMPNSKCHVCQIAKAKSSGLLVIQYALS